MGYKSKVRIVRLENLQKTLDTILDGIKNLVDFNITMLTTQAIVVWVIYKE